MVGHASPASPPHGSVLKVVISRQTANLCAEKGKLIGVRRLVKPIFFG